MRTAWPHDSGCLDRSVLFQNPTWKPIVAYAGETPQCRVVMYRGGANQIEITVEPIHGNLKRRCATVWRSIHDCASDLRPQLDRLELIDSTTGQCVSNARVGWLPQARRREHAPTVLTGGASFALLAAGGFDEALMERVTGMKTHRAIEEALARSFARLGWTARLEPVIGSARPDLVVQIDDGPTLVIEVKASERPVHFGTVAQVSAAKRMTEQVLGTADVKSAVATTSSLSPAARDAADNLGVIVLEHVRTARSHLDERGDDMALAAWASQTADAWAAQLVDRLAA